MSSLHAAKSALRKQMKSKLKQISLSERESQSDAVFRKLLKLPELIAAKRVSVYVSMPSEIDTEALIHQMLLQGKEVFIPRYRETSTFMEMIRIPTKEDFEALPLTKWKICQPAEDVDWPEALDRGGLDVMFCPGLAFTREGHRLGRGMGYYDRYINRLQETSKRPTLVGLALKEQICDSVPCESLDVILDKVITSDT